MVFRRKPIVILKEQNMPYHPIVLSQFSIFSRKLTFFEWGGGLNSKNVGRQQQTWQKLWYMKYIF